MDSIHLTAAVGPKIAAGLRPPSRDTKKRFSSVTLPDISDGEIQLTYITSAFSPRLRNYIVSLANVEIFPSSARFDNKPILS